MGGWIALIVVVGLFGCAGGAAVAACKRAFSQQREREALSASDLRLLEESVEALIERLKAASDEAVREIDARQRDLRALIDRAEALRADGAGAADAYDPEEVCRLAREGMEEAEIALRSGFTRGEVELMLELQAARE